LGMLQGDFFTRILARREQRIKMTSAWWVSSTGV
jgi:hypothetical protein